MVDKLDKFFNIIGDLINIFSNKIPGLKIGVKYLKRPLSSLSFSNNFFLKISNAR